ncbi:MAG: hypothetical protein ACOYK9_03635 [Chlamydiia bacterium]
MRCILGLLSIVTLSLVAEVDYVFVVTEDSYEVVNVQTQTVTTLKSFPLLYNNFDTTLAISENGAVASISGAGGVQIFDPTNIANAVTFNPELATPWNGSISADGKTACFSYSNEQNVSAVSVDNLFVWSSQIFGFRAVQIANNGAFICGVGEGESSPIQSVPLQIFPLGSNTTKVVTYPDRSKANVFTFFISEDSSKIYAILSTTSVTEWPIVIINPQTGFIEKTIIIPAPVNGVPYRIIANSENDKLALTVRPFPSPNNDKQIWIVDLNNPLSPIQAPQTFTGNGYGVLGRMSFSKDGNTLFAFYDDQLNAVYNLYKIDTDANTTTLIQTFSSLIRSIASITTSVEGTTSKYQTTWQTNYFNLIRWDPVFSPAQFLIYRNQELIATVPGTDRSFNDPYLEPKTGYTYEVIAVENGGSQLNIGKTTIVTSS